MTINLYKVEVRDATNKKVSIYLKLTTSILQISKKHDIFLIPTLLTTLTYTTEEELFNQLPYYLKKLNVDLYYTNALTSQTYYYPIEIKPLTTKELPMSHDYPNRKIENIKQMNWYRKITYKGLEKIIKRKGYLLSTNSSSIEYLLTYLKQPTTLSTYSTYIYLFKDKFKAFLLLLRDFFTTVPIDNFQTYYYYIYNRRIVELGYYSRKQVKVIKSLKEWVLNDKGKDLRNNSLLLPIELQLLKQLWYQFNQ